MLIVRVDGAGNMVGKTEGVATWIQIIILYGSQINTS